MEKSKENFGENLKYFTKIVKREPKNLWNFSVYLKKNVENIVRKSYRKLWQMLKKFAEDLEEILSIVNYFFLMLEFIRKILNKFWRD